MGITRLECKAVQPADLAMIKSEVDKKSKKPQK